MFYKLGVLKHNKRISSTWKRIFEKHKISHRSCIITFDRSRHRQRVGQVVSATCSISWTSATFLFNTLSSDQMFSFDAMGSNSFVRMGARKWSAKPCKHSMNGSPWSNRSLYGKPKLSQVENMMKCTTSVDSKHRQHPWQCELCWRRFCSQFKVSVSVQWIFLYRLYVSLFQLSWRSIAERAEIPCTVVTLPLRYTPNNSKPTDEVRMKCKLHQQSLELARVLWCAARGPGCASIYGTDETLRRRLRKFDDASASFFLFMYIYLSICMEKTAGTSA